uniref:Embryo defective 2735 n=2 Tax=Solanum lycopersicum TaxID=4081 RepID=A0A3Q7IMI2_SOLLC
MSCVFSNWDITLYSFYWVSNERRSDSSIHLSPISFWRSCFTIGLRMKLKVVWRKVSDYVRYDLKEIAFPSSLPDPPHFKKRRKLSLKERYLVLKEASRLYAASWVRDIGPELRPNDYKKKREIEGELDGNGKEKEPSTLEDLAVAARGGMETLRPALQRVYMTRASAYKDALKSFIQGYQEGIQQTMEKTEDSKSSKDTDASNSKGLT